MGLELLFGSKSVKRIFFFLLVNETCFGSELSRLLEVPLTPIQKALIRLEEAKVVVSEYVGKTRLYKFNADYPLLMELEALIKRAYADLPVHEKKKYIYIAPKKVSVSRLQRKVLFSVWEGLKNVSHVKFSALSKTPIPSGWNGMGEGSVNVATEKKTIVFHEKGQFCAENGNRFTFRNVFRFTLDRLGGMISLEHLRLGANRPVFLFHLIASGDNLLESMGSHLCGQDAYFGKIYLNEAKIHLHWRILGPKKNAELDYVYDPEKPNFVDI